MSKGKNGQMLAEEYSHRVRAWIAQRNLARDWDEYAYNNRINRRVLADELDFSKSVCTQNNNIRKLLEDADDHWFRTKAADRASLDAARERAEKHSSVMSSNNGNLIKRVAELEAENRQLRQELAAYKQQQALIECGASGFRL